MRSRANWRWFPTLAGVAAAIGLLLGLVIPAGSHNSGQPADGTTYCTYTWRPGELQTEYKWWHVLTYTHTPDCVDWNNDGP